MSISEDVDLEDLISRPDKLRYSDWSMIERQFEKLF